MIDNDDYEKNKLTVKANDRLVKSLKIQKNNIERVAMEKRTPLLWQAENIQRSTDRVNQDLEDDMDSLDKQIKRVTSISNKIRRENKKYEIESSKNN